MTEQRKPIFGFLWPSPDPNAPVDGDYHQTRLVRVCGRGPVRVIALSVLTLATIALLGSALMAALVTAAIVPTVITAAVGATLTFIVLRGWIVGTYVNDDLVRIETLLGRRTIPLAEVSGCVTAAGSPFLGTFVRTSAERVWLECGEAGSVATHVYQTSPDLWLRAEAYDIARSRLQRWTASS